MKKSIKIIPINILYNSTNFMLRPQNLLLNSLRENRKIKFLILTKNTY